MDLPNITVDDEEQLGAPSRLGIVWNDAVD